MATRKSTKRPARTPRRKPALNPIDINTTDELAIIDSTVSICADAAAEGNYDSLAVVLLQRVHVPLQAVLKRLDARTKVRP